MRGKNIILIIKKGRRGEEKEIEMGKKILGKAKRLMGWGTRTPFGMGLF